LRRKQELVQSMFPPPVVPDPPTTGSSAAPHKGSDKISAGKGSR
jgi:hypothetical protein